MAMSPSWFARSRMWVRLRRCERVVENASLLAGLFVQTRDCTRNYSSSSPYVKGTKPRVFFIFPLQGVASVSDLSSD